MGFAIAGGQWLNEVQCFYQTSELADSSAFQIARHRKPPNRYMLFFPTPHCISSPGWTFSH